jgi:hypothetical protein
VVRWLPRSQRPERSRRAIERAFGGVPGRFAGIAFGPITGGVCSRLFVQPELQGCDGWCGRLLDPDQELHILGQSRLVSSPAGLLGNATFTPGAPEPFQSWTYHNQDTGLLSVKVQRNF